MTLRSGCRRSCARSSCRSERRGSASTGRRSAQVLDKLTEEARELAEARDELTQDQIEEEMGDLLFVAANLARWLNVDPEAALRRANGKFVRRFKAIEAGLAASGRRPEDSTLAEMDAIWNEIRALDKIRGNKSGLT